MRVRRCVILGFLIAGGVWWPAECDAAATALPLTVRWAVSSAKRVIDLASSCEAGEWTREGEVGCERFKGDDVRFM